MMKAIDVETALSFTRKRQSWLKGAKLEWMNLKSPYEKKAKAVVEAQEKPTEQSAVDVFNQKLEFRFDTTKPPEEQAKDIIGVKATAKAIEDEDLTKGVTDRKKGEILNHADAHLKKEEAENKKADTLLRRGELRRLWGCCHLCRYQEALAPKKCRIFCLPFCRRCRPFCSFFWECRLVLSTFSQTALIVWSRNSELSQNRRVGLSFGHRGRRLLGNLSSQDTCCKKWNYFVKKCLTTKK